MHPSPLSLSRCPPLPRPLSLSSSKAPRRPQPLHPVGFADTIRRAQGMIRARGQAGWSGLGPKGGAAAHAAVDSQPRSARHCLPSCAFGGIARGRKAPRALTDCLFGSVPGRMPRESPHPPRPANPRQMREACAVIPHRADLVRRRNSNVARVSRSRSDPLIAKYIKNRSE